MMTSGPSPFGLDWAHWVDVGVPSAVSARASRRERERVDASAPRPTADRTHASTRRFRYGEQARYFDDELRPHLKHTKKGTVGMASAGKDANASQFYVTTGDEITSLDEKNTVRRAPAARDVPVAPTAVATCTMHPARRVGS